MENYKFQLECKKSASFESAQIIKSEDAFKYARQLWGSDIFMYESCFILLLDHGNNTMGWAKISQGGVALSIMDVKIICKYAVETLASGVVLLHNHPSGNMQPSAMDKKTTARIKEALKVFEVELLDHLIISDEKYFSFNDEGLFL